VAVGVRQIRQAGEVLDERRWPVVDVELRSGRDAEALIDRLEELVAREAPFALRVTGPGDLAGVHRLLAPHARARLRRVRPALGTWCVGAAHVMHPADVTEVVWPGEVVWGCPVKAVGSTATATAWLRERLSVA
jgi:hypothetical protein